MKINIVSQNELDAIPEGDPIPSVCSPVGYGNHSCQDCIASDRCPIYGYTGHVNQPNGCSFYWPPNSPNFAPGEWYWKELEQIAKERKQAGL